MQQQPWSARLVRYQYIEALIRGSRVLEIGCGRGVGTDYLAERAREVVCIDSSPAVVSRARGLVHRKNVRFVVGTPGRFEADGGNFDWVLVPQLQDFVDDPALVATTRRLLNPRGRALFTIPARPAAPGAMDYKRFVEHLRDTFGYVRVLGEVPFHATAMADFQPDDGGLQPLLDCSLIKEDESPLAYTALCSNDLLEPLGYSVIQIRPEGAREQSGSGHQQRLQELQQTIDQLRAQLRSEQQRASQLEVVEQEREGLRDRLEVLEHQLSRSGAPADADEEELRRKLADAERRILEATSSGRHELTDTRQRLHASEQRARQLEQQLAQQVAELTTLRRQRGRGQPVGSPDVDAEKMIELALGDRPADADLKSWATQRLAEQLARAAQLSSELERVRTDKARLQAEYDAQREQIGGMKERAEGAERRADGLLARLDQDAAELSRLHQRLAEVQGLRQADQWRMDELTGRLRETEGRKFEAKDRTPISDVDKALAVARARIEELERQLAAKVDQATVSEQAGAVAASAAPPAAAAGESAQLAEALQKIAELEKKLMRAESREVEVQRRATNAESRVAQLEVRLKRSTAEASTLSRWAGELRGELKDAKGESTVRPATPEPEVVALRNDLAKAKQRVVELEARCDRLIAQTNQARAELEKKDEELQLAIRAADDNALTDLKARAEQVRRMEQQLRAAKERISELEQTERELLDSEKATAELVVARRELAQTKATLSSADDLSAEVDALRAKLAAAERREAELQARLERGAKEPAPLGIERERDGERGEQGELLSLRERQLESLLDGALAHKEETEQLRAQVAEQAALVEALEQQRQSLTGALAAQQQAVARLEQRAEVYEQQAVEARRVAARLEGELKRYVQA